MEKNNVDIRDYTTYKLEGKIKKIYFPEDVSSLKKILKKLKNENIKYKVIGNGSNLIISSNYDGVLIKLEKFGKLEFKDNIIVVSAAYSLMKFYMECAKKGLSGLEFAAYIPATVGGAICQNAGAYGKQMDSIIQEVTVLDNNEIKKLKKEDLKLGYRDSIFKHQDLICLEAVFKLTKANSEEILNKMHEYLKLRKEKQPLEYPSAGSVFRNPLGMSAGKLIEDAGLKGYKIGDAMVSVKHANFIINLGHANSDDVIQLIEFIQKKVYEKTGIKLEAEQEFLE